LICYLNTKKYNFYKVNSMGGVKGKVAKIPLGDTQEDKQARLKLFK
jgi:hypothetical protein